MVTHGVQFGEAEKPLSERTPLALKLFVRGVLVPSRMPTPRTGLAGILARVPEVARVKMDREAIFCAQSN